MPSHHANGVASESRAARRRRRNRTWVEWERHALAIVLDEQLARRVAESLDARFSDQDALGDFEAPVVEPQARHEMERHAGFEDGLVPGAQAHRALAPVRRIACADRVAAAAVFLDARLTQHREEPVCDVLPGV